MIASKAQPTSSTTDLSKEALMGMYEKMLLIRRFEERVAELFAQGHLPGFVHLYIGQEAVAVGVCSVLQPDDYISSTHRGHGHTIAKGGDVKKMMAELHGKATGYCKGKGGSMHLTDMKIGMLGANGIVAGGVPLAMGAAYGIAKVRKTHQVVASFFGDAAVNEGAFHEAANMAAAWKLPVIFVCENNQYAVGTRLAEVVGNPDLASRAAGYGMKAVSVDGNDVLAVYEAASEAVERARAGKGPSFLECKTWRHRGHFEGENPTYFDEKERQTWLEKDPINHFGQQLIDMETATQAELDELDSAVRGQITDAVKFAEESPMPAPEDALEDVYTT
jgi:pyruvate dehydrogenase E1 component alpha subunit